MINSSNQFMDRCTDLLTPLEVSQKLNQTVLPNLNYTSQDYDSLKTRLVQYIQENFPDDFTDFVEGSLAFMLIETAAFIGDTLSFKIDQIVNEIFIDTVTEIENAFRLCELVGFQPQPPIAARAFFSATIQTALTTDLNLGNAIQLSLSSPAGSIYFELFPADSNNNPILEGDVLITAGSFSNTNIIGLEGQTQIDTITAQGNANQSYQLQQSPVLYDSIRVSVDGSRWQQVDFFSDSNPRNEFRIEFDSNYRAFLIFGNGRAGRAPVQGSAIEVVYRVGGGLNGNIIAGTLLSQRGYTVPGFNFAVPITFRNYTKGEFGYAGDTLEDIRRKLPEYLKTQNRAVSGEDYQINASQFVSPYNGQAAKAVAALRNHGCAGNVIDIYILVKDGADGVSFPTDDFKSELSTYLETIKMMTDYLCIRDGAVIDVDVTLDVTINKFYRKFKDELDRKIRNRLADFFSLNNWDFGKTLKDTELAKAMTDITEINNLTVDFTTIDVDNSGTTVTAKYYELIRPDVITVNLIFE